MSMEKKRDEIGKLLTCLLVSKKGASSIRDLERDYYESEGHNIPYRDFGCLNSLDFFRSISKHVKLEPRSGIYWVYPVVSDKMKHVNDLVARQRPAKRHTPVRRRPARTSRYFPQVRDPKPFVPNIVQQEIARILKLNPWGVNKNYIAQCLERSIAIAGTVNVNNIDEYVSGMPYTAFTRGNLVYPSQSLKATIDTAKREVDGFEIVTPREFETPKETLSRNNNAQETTASYPAGSEQDEEIYDEDYYEEYGEPPLSNLDDNYGANNNHQSQQLLTTDNGNRPRMSSAEFIDRARLQYTQSQSQPRCDELLRQNNNYYQNGVRLEDIDNREQKENSQDSKGECTFVSDEDDDDDSIDIISSRIKSRLQQLIEKHSDGIWCADLLQAYLDEFKVPLDYADLGYGSVCELASNIPKVFRLHRQNNRGDFMLYDATKPLPPSADKPESNSASDIWEVDYYDDDVDPFPMALPLLTSKSLVPNGVMTLRESVGQEKIPEIRDGQSECLEIYVVEVYTPSLFWIQLRKKRSKLSQLMQAMDEFYRREGDKYTIPQVILEKGLNCVCLFQDKWHRAIIKTVKPDGDVTLMFYDYGTTKTYPPDELRYLVRAYSNLPAQGIPCGLWNVKPVNADAWTRGVSSEFYCKVADTPLVAMVLKVDSENNSMMVSLVDTHDDTDDHINDWLVQKGLAELGSMGDTVSMEYSYLEDLISQAQDSVVVHPEGVPLVTPQSTLNVNSGCTLKPPPGLAKPTEPMNYAAFMDECLNGRNYGNADMANSTLLNSGIGDLNSNLLTSFNMAQNLSPLSEAFIQFCKQRVEMELATAINQFLLSNSNASIINNMIPNNSSPASPAVNTNPILEQSCTNPFRTRQKVDEQRISTTAETLEESTNTLMNLNLNESNHSNVQNDTILPNVSSRDSDPLGFNTENLFSSKSMKRSCTASNEFTESRKYQSNRETFLNEWLNANDEKIVNNEECSGHQLHNTNPFKEHVIGSFDRRIDIGEGKEQRLRREFEYNENIVRPPIPPRNPNLINTRLPVYNNQQNIPSTKIYYQADPVLYNLKPVKTDEPNEVNDPVSLHGKNDHNMKSSQDSTNHSLSSNTSYDFETINSPRGNSSSSQLGFSHSQPHSAQTNNIYTPSAPFDMNTKKCLNPRILSNSYRPPPPPYNENTSVEYLYKTKTPISPRFTSPLVSENSKAAIEEIQLATDGLIETPASAAGRKSLGSQGAHEKYTSSSSPLITNNNTNSESTSDCENLAWPNTFYIKNLTLPKLLQEQQTTKSSKQHQPDMSSNEKVLNDTSRTDPVPNPHEQHNSVNEKGSVYRDANCNPYPHQPFTPQFAQQFPNMGNLPPRPYYPYSMPYGDVRPQLHPPVGQTTPVFRPNGHGFYTPPPPHWPQPQFFNPAFPYMRNYCPPPPQPPYVWNPYDPHVFAPKQTSNKERTAHPNSRKTSQMYSSRESVSPSGLTHSPTLKQDIKETVNSPKIKETQIDAPRLDTHIIGVPQTYSSTDPIYPHIPEELTDAHSNKTSNLKNTLSNELAESSSQRTDESRLENGTENCFQKDSPPEHEVNSIQSLQAQPPRINVEKSSNGPVHITHQSSTGPVSNIFKPIVVNDHTIYLFNIENQGWVSTDEIAQVFTTFENRNPILRILNDIVQVHINFMEVSRAQSPFLFDKLDCTSIRLPRLKNSKKIKGTLHLTPLKSLKQMLFYLEIVSMEDITNSHLERELPRGSRLPELLKLIAAYSREDKYWVA